MKTRKLISLLFAAMVFFLFISTANSLVYRTDWSVVRHAKTEFTAHEMDSLLTDGNARVSLFDYSCTDSETQADIPCALQFVRKGEIGTFGKIDDGLNIIDTEIKLDKVFKMNLGKIIVVDEVNFCGGEKNPLIIGCGQLPGNTFVVEKKVEADVFIHEFGHNAGLDHRDECEQAIMHSSSPVTNGLIESECTAMGGKKYTELSAKGEKKPLNVNDEPYWAKTNVIVPADQTLTIEPNVNIQFNAGVSIKGKLVADGRNGPIRLYSNCSGDKPCPRVYP